MDVRTFVRMYVRTDVHDVMAIKPNFLTSMGYHIFLPMVLCARLRLWCVRSSANTNPASQEHLAFEIFASPLLLTTSISNE